MKVAYEKDEDEKQKLAKEVMETTLPKFVKRAEKLIKDNGSDVLVGEKVVVRVQ